MLELFGLEDVAYIVTDSGYKVDVDEETFFKNNIKKTKCIVPWSVTMCHYVTRTWIKRKE